MKFFKLMNRFNREEDGATAIEYGLFAALIAALIVTAVSNIGETTNASFEKVSAALCQGDTTIAGCS
ncbi:Flp family type IVb pilin [Celeribacter halophilus]|uniref:Flp family type IVb pilin n=1 Tax=Celeribacter halophilus TaxID=576117 RepID=UPI003A8DA104